MVIMIKSDDSDPLSTVVLFETHIIIDFILIIIRWKGEKVLISGDYCWLFAINW